ncbi:transketolase family protein [Propionibacteriaceae bacterium Y1923]|uniref:transketolase family protein n=1 Tax=Aestuariimicrobium sp. Y1814 TaxID=3418742 RepID=UPI003C18AA74
MSNPTPSNQTYDPRKEFGRAVAEVAEDDERVVVISTDSGKSSGFGDFLKAHPERYFEVGIEEQGATGLAAGLATTGKIPVFCAIAPFVTARNYEQFRNDIGYMEQNVKIVGRNGGMTYADLGSTHHSLEDYAIIRMIPGVTILAPQDYSEIRAGVKAMIEHDGPVYMRIGAGNVPVLFEEDFEIGKGRHVRRGSQVTIVSAGYQTIETMKAVDALVADGIDVDLICLGTIVPLDEQLVLESARRTGHVITVEEHYDRGGLGGIVSELIAHEGGAVVDIIAVPHTFVHTGTYAGLQQQHGLDAASLRTRITDLVARRATP